MRLKSATLVAAAALVAMSLAAFPGSALAGTDYSRNSANGEYNVSPAVRAASHLNYAMNSANGQYDVEHPSSSTAGHVPVQVVQGVTGGSGFAWGDALLGAGVTLLVMLAIGAARGVRRRRVGPAAA